MQWKCGVCQNVFPGATAPEKCPICGASQEKFSQYSLAQAQEVITPNHVNVLEKLQLLDSSLSKVVNIKTEQLGADTYYFNPGQVLAYHQHPDSDQIFFVISGKGKFYLDNGVEQVFDVAPGSIVLAPKGVWHQLVNTGTEPLVTSQATKLPVTSLSR